MASHNHHPKHTYERGGFASNDHGGQSNGGRGNGKRGRGNKFANSNYYVQNYSCNSYEAYQGPRSVSGESRMPAYPVGPPSAMGVPVGGLSPSMENMYSTPNAWHLPGVTAGGAACAAYGQESPAIAHRIPQHMSSYGIPPPHMTPTTSSSLPACPSSQAHSITPGINTEYKFGVSIHLVSSTSEQALIGPSLHESTTRRDAVTIVQHNDATPTVSSSPVQIDRFGQNVFENTSGMPPEKTLPLSKNHASVKTPEELAQMLDYATFTRLQMIDTKNTLALQKTLYDALEKRHASQREVCDKRSALLSQLKIAREHATYYNHGTFKSYEAFVEKMIILSSGSNEEKDTVQRKAIECLKVATEYSKRATKCRNQVESYRDALEALESMTSDLTTDLVNTIHGVVVKALQSSVTPDMVTSSAVVVTPEVTMTVNSACMSDSAAASDLVDGTETLPTTEVKTGSTEDTHGSEPEPENAEKLIVGALTSGNFTPTSSKNDNHTTDDTALSGEVIQPAISSQNSQTLRQTTSELTESKTALSNAWANFRFHIENDDKEMKRQAREDFDHQGVQTFRPELKEMYKDKKGKSQQTVHKRVEDNDTAVTVDDPGSSLDEHADRKEPMESSVVTEPISIILAEIEAQTETEKSEKSVSGLEEREADQIMPQDSVKSIEAANANYFDVEEPENDVHTTTDTSGQSSSSHGLVASVSVAALQTMIQCYTHEKTPKNEQKPQTHQIDPKTSTQEAQKNQPIDETPVKQNVPASQASGQMSEHVAAGEQKGTLKRHKNKKHRAKTDAKKKAQYAAEQVGQVVSPVKEGISDGPPKGG